MAPQKRDTGRSDDPVRPRRHRCRHRRRGRRPRPPVRPRRRRRRGGVVRTAVDAVGRAGTCPPRRSPTRRERRAVADPAGGRGGRHRGQGHGRPGRPAEGPGRQAPPPGARQRHDRHGRPPARLPVPPVGLPRQAHPGVPGGGGRPGPRRLGHSAAPTSWGWSRRTSSTAPRRRGRARHRAGAAGRRADRVASPHRPRDRAQPRRPGRAVAPAAFRAALPFTAGVATADPEGLARAAAEVDTPRLGAA